MHRFRGAPTQAASLCLLLAQLAACGSEPTTTTPASAATVVTTSPVVATAALSASADTVVVGGRVRLSLVTRDAAGLARAPATVDWSLADSTVAQLVSTGLAEAVVYAARAGTVTVRAVADGRSASTNIVVLAPPPVLTSVRVTASADTAIAGQTVTLTLDARDDRGATIAPRDLTWSAPDSAIAAFMATGSGASLVGRLTDPAATEVHVRARAPGLATLAIQAESHTASARLLVLPRVAALRVRTDTVRLHVGESVALSATTVDSLGAPLPGRPIAWRSSDTTIASVRSDGSLVARARGMVAISATAEGVTSTVSVVVRPVIGDVASALALEIATYDGSGQVVHPDVLRLPRDWNGHRFWMAITPYPNANESFENPSIYTSDDGETWRTPPGATNPVAKVAAGHLSDPALVYDEASNRLVLYYRDAVGGNAPLRDDIYMVSSADGVKWSARELVYSDTGRYVVSPSVVRGADARWRVWSVDAGFDGCSAGGAGVVMRSSSDGRKWTAARAVSLAQPGYVPWHIDVQWVAQRREYWALLAAYRVGSACGSTDLFLATSPDGERWTTYASPILAHGVAPAFEAAVYRSSFLMDAAGDSLTLWMSGARRETDPKKGIGTRWSAAIARTSVASLLKRISATTVTIGGPSVVDTRPLPGGLP